MGNLNATNWLVVAAVIMFIPLSVEAYIGPGAGLTAIGTFVALVLIIILALVAFVWYPAKRAWKKRKADKSIDNE